MDHIQEEDCIPVGSTGTLLALMGKEMEILQARRSNCSASPYNHLHCKKSPPNSTHYASYYSVYGSPATPSMSPSSSSSSSFVASLWSDLKSLLRSPSSMHHHNFAAHTPLIYHSNEDYDSFYSKSPPLRPHSHPSPLTPLSYPSPKRTYPKQAMPHPQAPPHIRSPSSKETYPKQKVATEASFYTNQKSTMDDGYFRKKADYPQGKPPLHNCSQEGIATEAADYSNRNRTSPLHYRSQKRSDSVYLNQSNTDADVYKANPSAEIDQESLKGATGDRPANLPQERSSHAGTAVGKSSPKGKTMDAASSNLQYPAYPKAKAMDAVYAMRRSTASDVHSQNGKVLQDKEAREGASTCRSRKNCSRRRLGEREITSCRNTQEQAYCMQRREERSGYLQNDQYPCVRKREERERMQGDMGKREERVCCMQESYEGCMQESMLADRWQQADSCTPASSPLNMTPCFKPSRSFGGRSLPLVSVVDLQCCLTAERSSRRLSFTRLASF